MPNETYLLIIAAVIGIGVLITIADARHMRRKLTEKYDRGVQAYKDKDYEASLEIFDDLCGWEPHGAIPPEIYREMAMDELAAEGAEITICPHCGHAIIKDADLGEDA